MQCKDCDQDLVVGVLSYDGRCRYCHEDFVEATEATDSAERIAKLEDALKRIADINWGCDGDCGAQAIIDSVM